MDELINEEEMGATGAIGDEDEVAEVQGNDELDPAATDSLEEADEPASEILEDEAMDDTLNPPTEEVETAQYEITGLVDFSDEQGNIRGQLPVGSVQSLPTVVGDKAVQEGRAIRVE